MGTILQESMPKTFKSPKMKLIRFFERSRNKWKARAKDATYKIKLLTKKIKYLEQNKISQKERINQLESELQKIKDREKQTQNQIDQIKKKAITL